MISFVVAMDQNRVIGKDNRLPWHLPADLQYFKRLTMGHTIVMGRKTHESIGKPLPGRKNVIITKNQEYSAIGCEIIHSIEEMPNPPGEELFVIGGAHIFEQLLAKADKLYITLIHHSFEGDVWFPHVDESKWVLTHRQAGQLDELNRYPHEFLVYVRKG